MKRYELRISEYPSGSTKRSAFSVEDFDSREKAIERTEKAIVASFNDVASIFIVLADTARWGLHSGIDENIIEFTRLVD